MKRTYIPFVKKYVMAGACKCDVERMEREELENERKMRKARMERAFAKSMMNDRLKQATFDNFLPRPGTESVRQAAEDFAYGFENSKEGLLFFGRPGNGKSHLLAAIHHYLDEQGYVCLFLDWSQLSNLAKDTFNKNSKITLTDIVNSAIQCDLLTLDELGSGGLTEYEYNNILFPIINGRQGKKTNYSMNLDLPRLKQWFEKDRYGNPLDIDGRIFDRILGFCSIYENKGTSKRQEDAMRRLQGE
ncbi:ATP-binding protein [Paenibacillus larvae]|nr:ATP-binding protein [Paenibacillus larvae]MCY9527493.1 ATP-binding protein [Paenibacillus larvae]